MEMGRRSFPSQLRDDEEEEKDEEWKNENLFNAWDSCMDINQMNANQPK